MKYKTNKIIILILLVLILTLTTACGIDKKAIDLNKNNQENISESSEGPVEGGQIILPLTNFNTLNPLKIENKSYYYFTKLIYESLFEFGNDFSLKEQLVESYKIKDMGRSIEIKLKDNIFWHDGVKLSVEDVAFTIDTIKQGENFYKEVIIETLGDYGSKDINSIINTSIIDDMNIVINFDQAYSNNLEVLTFPIIAKHIFTNENNNKIDYNKALSKEDYDLVGTGPFKLDSYEKKKQIKLKSNENYREGKPYIDEIIGRLIGSEEDILTAFETGQINMTTTTDIDWDKYNQNSRINVLEYISSNYEFLGFNFAKQIFLGEEGLALRKAIAYGIDRQNIIESVYLGHGTQTDLPIHPDSWLSSQASNSFGYNIEEAKKELEKIGWKDINGDGILQDSSGKNISLDILTNTYNPMRLKIAEIIKDDLLKLGININIKPQVNKDIISEEDIEAQWTQINQELSKNNYDIALLGWQLSTITDLSFAFHSSKIYGNDNIIKYSNEEMDRILEETFYKGTRESKVKSYENLQNIIIEDLPYLSLFFKNKALLVDNKISGDLNPMIDNPYNGIEKAYILEKYQ